MIVAPYTPSLKENWDTILHALQVPVGGNVSQLHRIECKGANTEKILVVTIAFWRGIDCPNICRVIHFELAGCIENLIQETGGDGLPSIALKWHCLGEDYIIIIDDCIKRYIENTAKCRRDLILMVIVTVLWIKSVVVVM